MTPPLRITVGIACHDHFKPQMAVSLIGMIVQNPHDWHLTVKTSCYLDVNREACVVQAIEDHSDYLMFIDTDIQFPADGVNKLLACRKDIIGGAYNERRLPIVSTVKPFGPDGESFLTGQWTMPPEPFKVAAVGTGFMCINMKRILATMSPPFFSYSSQNGKFMGEDVAFCLRARAAGLEVWCDPTIPLKHIGEAAY